MSRLGTIRDVLADAFINVVTPLIVKLTNVSSDAFSEVDVQYPLPTDSDSVYAKDIWVDQSVSTGWVDISATGLSAVLVPFTNLHSVIQYAGATNPKILLVHFNRTVSASQISLGAYTGNFSNVKLELLGSAGAVRDTIDLSADSTDLTSLRIPFEPQLFNAFRLSFYTADTVSLSNITIQKTVVVAAQLQGIKPDDTLTAINATQGGNLKVSLEELENTISVNSNSQLRTTIYDELGYPARVEPGSSALIDVSFEHSKIHDGKHFFYSDFVTLGLGVSQDYMITTPAGSEKAHFTFTVTGTLSTDVSFFEGGDRTGTTLQTIRNNDRDSITASILTLHKGTSAGTTDGTDIHPDGFGTGVAAGQGGVSQRDNEMILKANTKYILRILSNVNGNRLSVHFDWYEHARINP